MPSGDEKTGSDLRYKRIKADVLIIGSGGAGLRAAIAAHDEGASVILTSKSLLGKAHTVMAEGGIAASLGDVDPEDDWKAHFADVIAEGAYLSNWRMAEILAKEAPRRVYELERYGALFDRTSDGKIMQRAFGGHKYRRLCHVGDKTGLEMIRALQSQILHRHIEVKDETFVTRLFKTGGRICGAMAIELRSGILLAIEAKAVILATGGCGRLYKITSNSWESTGDGLLLAYEAGAELMDMEMIQFHPTGMVYPLDAKGILVTEGVRGEGGILLNSKGERFMERYSPIRKELDARDVVARAVHAEIEAGNGTKHNGVYLDISFKGRDFIMKKLPGMYSQFMDFAGIDITKEKMEVAPTVHYQMGGVKVDAESAATRVDGLYAVGEVSAGLHGANRLGGNSLADILVFGRRCGGHAASYTKKRAWHPISDAQINAEVERITSYLGKEGVNPYTIAEGIREDMSKYAGIIRNGKGLGEALRDVERLKRTAKSISVGGSLKYNKGLVECFVVKGLLLGAEAILRSALMREESRGAHTRSDFPKKERKWLKNIICYKHGEGMALRTEAVPQMPERLSHIVKEEAYT